MNKRGAYFFVIDALIAASVIALSLIIIFGTHNVRKETTPTLRMVEDYTDYLVSTKVREFQGPYRDQLVNDGNITNLDNTLLEQLTEFYFQNKTRDTTTILRNFTEEISYGIVPPQRSVSLKINNSLIFSRENLPPNQSSLRLSSKKISFKKINDSYVYGPVIIEVSVWI